MKKKILIFLKIALSKFVDKEKSYLMEGYLFSLVDTTNKTSNSTLSTL